MLPHAVYVNDMIRTQIYLPKKQYDDVKLRARMSGKPAAEIIRGFIGEGLTVKQRPRLNTGGLLNLANLGITGGPKDLASKLDDYLYGKQT